MKYAPTFLAMLLVATIVAADDPPPLETKPPAPVDPAARAILDRLEAAGMKYAGLIAKVVQETINRRVGDSELRTGSVAWQGQTTSLPAMFRIQFDTVATNESRAIADKVIYGFDGRWLSVAKYRIKQLTRYEVVPPGSRSEPLKLGKGPFPVPFGQKTEEVLEFFQATTRETRGDEPANSDYLKLVPHPKHANTTSFTRLEMWVDRTSGLPVRVIMFDQARNVITATFSDIQTVEKTFDIDTFHLPRPTGWSYKEEPFKSEAQR